MKSLKRMFGRQTMLCFSPPVMMATVAVELGLAVIVGVNYLTSSTRRIIIAMLVLLAAFQVAELQVCGSSAPDLVWSRLGYVCITMLPPLGIHLIARLRRQSLSWAVLPSYILGAGFALAFAFSPTGLNHGVCTGNYVIFALAQPLSMYYMIYYFGLEVVAVGLSLFPLRGATRHQTASLRWIALAYALIMIPVYLIDVWLPSTGRGIPSIMCGFAVLFALILGLKVAPLTLQGQDASKVVDRFMHKG